MSLFTEGKLFNIANAESGGGGDKHNLGWYATQAELEEAHPTATAGDWAIVGSTDTVWIWDTDNDEWTDSGAKSPTYTAGTGISITNNEISATDPVLVNKSTATDSTLLGNRFNTNSLRAAQVVGISWNDFTDIIISPYSVIIGYSTSSSRQGGVAIGYYAQTSGENAIAIGWGAKATAQNAIQLGRYGSSTTNSDANTFKVANQNGNFELLSADGTIPTARLTKVNTTITLTAAGWSNGSQTVSVSGITSTGVVFVSPDPTDQADYTTAGILCTSQATDSLTFTCDTTPSSDISVVVVQM